MTMHEPDSAATMSHQEELVNPIAQSRHDDGPLKSHVNKDKPEEPNGEAVPKYAALEESKDASNQQAIDVSSKSKSNTDKLENEQEVSKSVVMTVETSPVVMESLPSVVQEKSAGEEKPATKEPSEQEQSVANERPSEASSQEQEFSISMSGPGAFILPEEEEEAEEEHTKERTPSLTEAMLKDAYDITATITRMGSPTADVLDDEEIPIFRRPSQEKVEEWKRESGSENMFPTEDPMMRWRMTIKVKVKIKVRIVKTYHQSYVIQRLIKNVIMRQTVMLAKSAWMRVWTKVSPRMGRLLLVFQPIQTNQLLSV